MTTNFYDEIPYTKHIYQQTQPNHLATIATLFGIPVPPIETCRVLELGCASGINTIAMAQAIPNGEFIGIDFSEQQIKEGQNHIRQLKMSNIILQQKNILEIDTNLGLFDYIVAHGVYSWVSPTVRDKILQICHHHLQPNGIAYVSYNIYPGWHIDRMLREMMLYRTQHLTDPNAKLEQAKALLHFFTESLKQKFDSYSLLLRNELHHISQLNENYLVHEYLEEHNEPVFFHDFIEHANHHGLQYVTDMRTPFIARDNFLSLEAGSLDFSTIEKEQYMDFLRNTPFRETLLCHQNIAINRNLVTDKISDFCIAAPLKLTSQTPTTTENLSESLKKEMPERFDNLAGEAVISVASPLLKAVCLCLGEIWPQSISFNILMHRVAELLAMVEGETGERKGKQETGNYTPPKKFDPGKNLQGLPNLEGLTRNFSGQLDQAILSPADIHEVKTMLIEFYLKKIVELSIYPPQFTLHISECPTASPIARLQSQQGKQVTNLRYEVFTLNFATRKVLMHLDGQQDRATLLEIMRQSIETGDFILYKDEQKLTLTEIDSEELHNHLSLQIEDILQNLAKKAYLIA